MSVILSFNKYTENKHFYSNLALSEEDLKI